MPLSRGAFCYTETESSALATVNFPLPRVFGKRRNYFLHKKNNISKKSKSVPWSSILYLNASQQSSRIQTPVRSVRNGVKNRKTSARISALLKLFSCEQQRLQFFSLSFLWNTLSTGIFWCSAHRFIFSHWALPNILLLCNSAVYFIIFHHRLLFVATLFLLKTAIFFIFCACASKKEFIKGQPAEIGIFRNLLQKVTILKTRLNNSLTCRMIAIFFFFSVRNNSALWQLMTWQLQRILNAGDGCRVRGDSCYTLTTSELLWRHACSKPGNVLPKSNKAYRGSLLS